jgi:hypothetical protein
MSTYTNDTALPPAPLPTISNRYELFAFLNMLCGEKTIGTLNNEEEVCVPTSPEVQAYLLGKFGSYFRQTISSMGYRNFPAYSSFFRSIANELDRLSAERIAALAKHGIVSKRSEPSS